MQPGLQFSDMMFDEDDTEINIADNSFNDADFVFDINRYRLLEHFKVGENACRGVSSFIIDNLNHLKSIEIGKLSFTLSSGPIVTRAFTISNCSELESIVLHPNNFSDYAHSFNLINLPSLKYLQIGEVGAYSTNFYKLSFSLKSSQSLFLLPFRPSQARNCDFRQRSLPIFRHYCVRRFAILSFFLLSSRSALSRNDQTGRKGPDGLRRRVVSVNHEALRWILRLIDRTAQTQNVLHWKWVLPENAHGRLL